ncbi:MAG: aldo/keto reductase [Actinomycetota bacterium]|nr:MAG: aldo/keto reductase [Actinomycetota bacterium]
MRYRTLGDSGLLVSVVGLGCNNFGARVGLEGTRAVLDAAIDVGVTLLDTADIYGQGASEELLGQALLGRRDQVVLATKFGHRAVEMFGSAAGAKGGRSYIRRAVDASLRRLQTDWIDLYQLHTPDPLTPIAETLSALDDLVREGKVRYVGSSNLTGWQLAEAAHTARELGLTAFVSAQNHWSWLRRDVEREVVPAAVHYGVGVLPYFPLANGLLTGKYRRGEAPVAGTRLAGRDPVAAETFDRIEALQRWAAEHGRTVLDVAVGGLAALPGVGSVIAGATRPEQVVANADAGEWVPTVAELAEISALVPVPD